MKIYRWYAEKLGMSGLTAHTPEASRDSIINEVYTYIANTFYGATIPYRKEDLNISVWPIEEDDDYNDNFPMTIATNY